MKFILLHGIVKGKHKFHNLGDAFRRKAVYKSASEYQDNTFSSHPEYYISYFKMRYGQCQVLHNLRDELVKIRNIPIQAAVVSEYMLHLAEYVIEINRPIKQIEYLNRIFEGMRGEELPKTREEFEDRAMLYHILMDLQDFLSYKAHFVDQLNQTQLSRYWNQNPSHDSESLGHFSVANVEKTEQEMGFSELTCGEVAGKLQIRELMMHGDYNILWSA